MVLGRGIEKIRIRGPKARIFFDKFANQQATSVVADGKDILSDTMVLESDEAIKKAFLEIEKLTDQDLDIEA